MFATHSDAVREYAINVGRDRPDSAWILDPRDVWSPNPFYTGAPVPHPESDDWCDQDPSVYYHFAAASARAKELARSGLSVLVRRADGGWKVHAS